MSEKTFGERLLAVQTDLKAPKGQYNGFGKYSYRSCEDILEAVKPLLRDNRLLLTIKDEPVCIEGRFYIKATAEVSDDKMSGRSISATAYAREEDEKKGMDASQVTGSASSYARKYALNGLFLIDDTKDADATNDHGKAPDKNPAKANRKPAKAPNQPNPQDGTMVAKARLWSALKAYCERHGLNERDELDEIGGSEFIAGKDAVWLNAKAEFYEAN